MSTTWQQLSPELARLQSYYESVRGDVANSTLAAEAYGGINGQLGTISKIMFRLKESGDLGSAAVRGLAGAADKWTEMANFCGGALQDILKQLGDEDLYQRLWTEVIVPTAKETKETLEQVGEGTLDVLHTLAVLFGLYVLLQVVKVVR